MTDVTARLMVVIETNGRRQSGMANINTSVLSGRLTKDAKVVRPENGDQTRVTLPMAVNRSIPDGDGGWKEDTLFIPVTIFGDKAERVADLQTGDYAVCTGRLSGRRWNDDQGVSHYSIGLVAFNVEPHRKARESAAGPEFAGEHVDASGAINDFDPAPEPEPAASPVGPATANAQVPREPEPEHEPEKPAEEGSAPSPFAAVGAMPELPW